MRKNDIFSHMLKWILFNSLQDALKESGDPGLSSSVRSSGYSSSISSKSKVSGDPGLSSSVRSSGCSSSSSSNSKVVDDSMTSTSEILTALGTELESLVDGLEVLRRTKPLIHNCFVSWSCQADDVKNQFDIVKSRQYSSLRHLLSELEKFGWGREPDATTKECVTTNTNEVTFRAQEALRAGETNAHCWRYTCTLACAKLTKRQPDRPVADILLASQRRIDTSKSELRSLLWLVEEVCGAFDDPDTDD